MLRFLLIFIGVLVLINIIGRILFKWIVRRLIRKSRENFEQYSQANTDEVIVNIRSKPEKRNTDKIGEYVDFEEIQ
ncbi:MAG TPA: hypothetical protein PK990_03170 [Salinivirgaceae bacterium]|nr:hypothetical protein [Salinivirgaceae bacterium]